MSKFTQLIVAELRLTPDVCPQRLLFSVEKDVPMDLRLLLAPPEMHFARAQEEDDVKVTCGSHQGDL